MLSQLRLHILVKIYAFIIGQITLLSRVPEWESKRLYIQIRGFKVLDSSEKFTFFIFYLLFLGLKGKQHCEHF